VPAAEYIGRLARRYHWRSVALVTITPQDTRARLRVQRCFAGPVYVVTTPPDPSQTSWPYQLAYQWGALLKALILQPSCLTRSVFIRDITIRRPDAA
jgi:hypothetical protein